MVSRLKLAILSDGRPAWKIARAANISPTAMSYLTTGRREPTQDERQALARVLHTPACELFPDEEIEHQAQVA